MSQLVSVFAAIKNEPYSTRNQLLEYTLRTIIQNGKKVPDQDDETAILQYAYRETDDLLSAIPNAVSYKEKDIMFTCGDLVLRLIMLLRKTPADVPADILVKIRELTAMTAKERYIETTLDKLFKQESIEEPEVSRLLSLVTQTSDEYQKGKFYAGLIYYAKELSKLSPAAKARITAYIAEELGRYLGQEQCSEDCLHNLELASDISKQFADDNIIRLLYEVLKLGYANVNYYAADTMLSACQSIPEEVILSLAQNLEYANLTYALLVKYGKQDVFPKEYSSPEYLAKSDLVHWLTYPTELGKEPDAIEYIGKITYLLKKEVYYVFKYRSDSDTLEDALKNKWLIGWSSDGGGTFSNFDEYALFEKETVSATLKNIKKKLL